MSTLSDLNTTPKHLATEACPLRSREKHSMEIAIMRLFMTICKIGLPTVIIECHRHFTYLPIIQQLTIRNAKFLQCFITSKNVVCSLFTNVAGLATLIN